MLLYVMKLMSNLNDVYFLKLFIENNLFLDFKLFIFKFFFIIYYEFLDKKKSKYLIFLNRKNNILIFLILYKKNIIKTNNIILNII